MLGVRLGYFLQLDKLDYGHYEKASSFSYNLELKKGIR
jgi:hypothetical protein